ncbi:hypothetical protein D3C87_1562450 [compost metagenome]
MIPQTGYACPLAITQQIAFERQLFQRRVHRIAGNRQMLGDKTRTRQAAVGLQPAA